MTFRPQSRRIGRLGGGPRLVLSWRRVNWNRLARPEFHGVIAAISGRERQSVPGSVRSHWRRRRFEALAYYEARFGPVPAILREWQLRRGASFYQSPDYRAWSRVAYDSPTPNPRFDPDPSQRRFAPLFRAGQADRWASL